MLGGSMNQSYNPGILNMVAFCQLYGSWRYEERRTTVGTFYNGAGLELGFRHSADARRSLIIHVLVGYQESASTCDGERHLRVPCSGRSEHSIVSRILASSTWQ